MSKEKYVHVNVILVRVRADAILIDTNPASLEARLAWVPRSLIHGGDEMRVVATPVTEQVTFRLMEWKADKLDL